MAKQIFRQEALDRLSSPEGLDQLFSLVGMKSWVPLSALGLLVAGAAVWAVLGRVPETVEGAGVLINPGRVRGLQATYGGQLIELRARSGQVVAKGEVLATLNQPEIRQQLQQAKTKHRELVKSNEIQAKLEAIRKTQEKALRTAQAALIDESIKNIEEMTAKLAEKTRVQSKEQRDKLARNSKELRGLYAALKGKLDNLRRLNESKLVTGDTVLQAESQLVDTNASLTNMELRLSELDLKDIDNQQNVIQQHNRIADLKIQRRDLELKDTQMEQEITHAQTNRASTLMEQEDRITQLEQYLEEQGAIKSPHAGRVLEVAVQAGQVLAPGARIGAMEVRAESGTESLKTLAYFSLKTGKRIKEGMAVRVTPANVERQRFGSIMGKVTRVSPFPITQDAAAALVGNPEIVQALVQKGGMIEVEIELERDEASFSGFRWTSAGPQLLFSAGITTSVRVTVEERSPISYLLPILQSSVGGGS